MISGCFDHSDIWSRTKICRRNRSSVVWASAIRSGRGASVAIRRPVSVLGEVGHEGLEPPLNLGPVGPRHPAAGPFEPAGLGVLVVDLAGVDLPDEDAGAGGGGVGTGAGAGASEAFIQALEACDELGAGG